MLFRLTTSFFSCQAFFLRTWDCMALVNVYLSVKSGWEEEDAIQGCHIFLALLSFLCTVFDWCFMSTFACPDILRVDNKVRRMLFRVATLLHFLRFTLIVYLTSVNGVLYQPLTCNSGLPHCYIFLLLSLITIIDYLTGITCFMSTLICPDFLTPWKIQFLPTVNKYSGILIGGSTFLFQFSIFVFVYLFVCVIDSTL